MFKLKLLSAGVIAAALLVPPTMAQVRHIASRHIAKDAYASVAPTESMRSDFRVGGQGPDTSLARR